MLESQLTDDFHNFRLQNLSPPRIYLQNGSNFYQVFLRTIVIDDRGLFLQFLAQTRNMIFLVIFQKIYEKKVFRFVPKFALKKASKTPKRKLANVMSIF